jgi:hypothetical protein
MHKVGVVCSCVVCVSVKGREGGASYLERTSAILIASSTYEKAPFIVRVG